VWLASVKIRQNLRERKVNKKRKGVKFLQNAPKLIDKPLKIGYNEDNER
jgi:hypothetical protein